MIRTQAAAVAGVAIAGATAVALLVGGEHAAPPAAIRSAVIGTLYPRYVSQSFTWDAAVDHTGYRLYLDGVQIGLVPATRLSTLVSMTCGVPHRFNVQPFNNKGFAPLAPPVYVTPPCDKATT